MPLPDVLHRLARRYGEPRPPRVVDPLEMILLENLAYLASDEKREAAFRELKKRVGTTPKEILAAPARALQEVAAIGGIIADERAERLRDIASIALEEFDGDLREVLAWPLTKARRALKRFPSIGDPGAEKILLFTGAHPVLALDSNALRVLVRLGYGREQKSYAATYRSAQEAATRESRVECAWLVRAHQLLRRHGQETCRRSAPECGDCPLARGCAYYRARA
jgi:endonuclease-3